MRYTQGRPLLSGTDYNGCFYLSGTGWGQLDLAMVVATELEREAENPTVLSGLMRPCQRDMFLAFYN